LNALELFNVASVFNLPYKILSK